ncbi:SAM-dependent methyltransferase [Nocardia sp. IBHARD005]|uniref:SAM-dependent methyltransferase n=1 Tax=Nocardia sp. IBHARD005 TaxID=3457765 RepID=UPI004059DA87
MSTIDTALFDQALAGDDCWVRTANGSRRPLPTRRWLGASDAVVDRLADSALICCCDGPTIDLGCGPGRLVAGLVRRGVIALGVDISPMAVAVSRFRGAPALRRDLFGPLPGSGRWAYAILADGNLGIGADPVRMLANAGSLLARDGIVVVEFAAPGTGMVTDTIRLETRTVVGEWFPWARVGIELADPIAAAAGLRVLTTANVSGRYIAWLHHSAPAAGSTVGQR